jgi:acetolactate decarboxylase
VKTPFALTAHFEGDTQESFGERVAESAFERTILDLIPSPNLMYAIRIDGQFDYVRARSVPKQSNYLPLAEIARLQTVFEFTHVAGTIVGFYTPQFLSGIHLAGLHLHFITADRTRGGHLLAATPNGITVGLQHAPAIELGLPMTLDFLTMERTRDMEADLNMVER